MNSGRPWGRCWGVSEEKAESIVITKQKQKQKQKQKITATSEAWLLKNSPEYFLFFQWSGRCPAFLIYTVPYSLIRGHFLSLCGSSVEPMEKAVSWDTRSFSELCHLPEKQQRRIKSRITRLKGGMALKKQLTSEAPHSGTSDSSLSSKDPRTIRDC